MDSRAFILQTLQEQLPYLRQKYGVARLALFGSMARNESTAESDVDLLVELERPLGLQFMALHEELERLLGREVDLLTPTGLASIRQQHIAQQINQGMVYVEAG